MFQEHSIWWSKTLLKYDEIIVKQCCIRNIFPNVFHQHLQQILAMGPLEEPLKEDIYTRTRYIS
jgi:hypothetical protein